MLEGLHYQNSYITRNLDKAIDSFRTRAQVDNILSIDVSVPVTTPRGQGTVQSKIALLWVNDLQYELIQPVSGLVDVYRDHLPASDSLRFHHAGMRVPDWDEFRQRVDQMRYEVVLEGGDDKLKFLYLDGRDLVGHYLEYTWMTPERWTAIGGK